jgi:hypothetical protein
MPLPRRQPRAVGPAASCYVATCSAQPFRVLRFAPRACHDWLFVSNFGTEGNAICPTGCALDLSTTTTTFSTVRMHHHTTSSCRGKCRRYLRTSQCPVAGLLGGNSPCRSPLVVFVACGWNRPSPTARGQVQTTTKGSIPAGPLRPTESQILLVPIRVHRNCPKQNLTLDSDWILSCGQRRAKNWSTKHHFTKPDSKSATRFANSSKQLFSLLLQSVTRV